MRFDCNHDTQLCARCGGSGSVECPHCDSGLVAYDLWSYRDEPFQFVDYCSRCDGSGQQTCPNCNGGGLIIPSHIDE